MHQCMHKHEHFDGCVSYQQVAFCSLCRTYTTLISHVKGKGRLQQVVDWCGGPTFDGCIVFDECHKAKNFVPGKEAQSTKVSPHNSTYEFP